MVYDEYGLPGDSGDEQDEQDLAAQLEAAKREVADLRKQRGATPPSGAQPAGSGSPAPAGGQGVDLDALVARVGDRSVPWDTLQGELAAAGFADARPAGPQRGMKPLTSRGVI
jgi:hypothetical protein